MAEMIELMSLDAPEAAIFARLTEAQLRNKLEPEKGLFIAESAKVIGTALDAGIEPVALLMDKRQYINPATQEILARCGEVPVYTAAPEVLEGITGFRLSRGILCAMRRPKERTAREICENARRVAVLEGIVDQTNVGAIFRSAAALGMDAVLLSPDCGDPLYRRSVRVSMGTVFQVPWARLGEDIVGQVHELGFKAAAMALDERAIAVDDPTLAREERLAVFLGTEGDGLNKSTIAACDYTVMIPMKHGVDSLNVAAASAVAFWVLR